MWYRGHRTLGTGEGGRVTGDSGKRLKTPKMHVVHTQDGYFCWRSKHFNQYNSSYADGFQSLSKAFHYHILLLTFYLLLWNYLLILKMPTETLLRISFSVIGGCSLMSTSHWLQGKCARKLVTGGFRNDFTESQTAFCWHFQCQNRRFRVLEAGYWKYFQNLINFKGASLNFENWFF
jgi:hypothetical protein